MPDHLCLICAKAKADVDRVDFVHRGEYLSTHLADMVAYSFTICDECSNGWHAKGLLRTNDKDICSRCHCSALSTHGTPLGAAYGIHVEDGFEEVTLCEGCLVALFDEAAPEAKPRMFCTIDNEVMPWEKYNWDGSEKDRNAVVGAPEMKTEPIAFKIEFKPADAGAKEKSMKTEGSRVVTGKVDYFKVNGDAVTFVMENGPSMSAGMDNFNRARGECGEFETGVEMVFYIDDGVVSWHPKDPLHGLKWDQDYDESDRFGVFEAAVPDGDHPGEHRIDLVEDDGTENCFWIKGFDQAESRFGKLERGKRYEWLVSVGSCTDIVGWREAPLAKGQDTVSIPKAPEPVGVPRRGYGSHGIFVRWEEDRFRFTSGHGEEDYWYLSGPSRDEAIARCGDMVPGKHYRWLWNEEGGAHVLGWREEPLAERPSPKDPMEGIDYLKEGTCSRRFGVFHKVEAYLKGITRVLLSSSSSQSDAWSCDDYKEVSTRCGELVSGKSYQFFFATKDWDLVGWKEAPIPGDLKVYHHVHEDTVSAKPAPEAPKLPAPAEKPKDPPLSALRFLAKRLGVKLPDDVASVGHATNVIEDALGLKMQQAMADTGFGVAHDIAQSIGLQVEDRQGEPLGSYRTRVQAAIEGAKAQAFYEGKQEAMNELMKKLEDQMEDDERQRRNLQDQLDRLSVRRATLQAAHLTARMVKSGGAS